MTDYQTKRTQWELDRNTAVSKAEGIINTFNKNFGWAFVDKKDSAELLVANLLRLGHRSRDVLRPVRHYIGIYLSEGSIEMKNRIILIPLFFLLAMLLVLQGCNFTTGESNEDRVATVEALQTSVAATVTAASSQAESTPLVEQAQATATEQAVVVQATQVIQSTTIAVDLNATQAALAPIQSDLSLYGVDPAHGSDRLDPAAPAPGSKPVPRSEIRQQVPHGGRPGFRHVLRFHLEHPIRRLRLRFRFPLEWRPGQSPANTW